MDIPANKNFTKWGNPDEKKLNVVIHVKNVEGVHGIQLIFLMIVTLVDLGLINCWPKLHQFPKNKNSYLRNSHK